MRKVLCGEVFPGADELKEKLSGERAALQRRFAHLLQGLHAPLAEVIDGRVFEVAAIALALCCTQWRDDPSEQAYEGSKHEHAVNNNTSKGKEVDKKPKSKE